MFLKKIIKKASSDSWRDAETKIYDSLIELLRGVGITNILKVSNNKADMANSIPTGIPITMNPKYYKVVNDFFYPENASSHNAYHYYVDNGVYWQCDGVNYFLGGTFNNSSNNSFFLVSEMYELAKTDYFNITLERNRNELGYVGGTIYGYDPNTWVGNENTLEMLVCRNSSTKTFYFTLKNYNNKYRVGGAHSSINNYSNIENDNAICLLPFGTIAPKKNLGSNEEKFLILNPLSYFGSDAFEYTSKIDLIKNKAYIQHPTLCLYRYGIVGEIKGIYFSTIPDKKEPGEIVSLGGTSYIYICKGMYFKNV